MAPTISMLSARRTAASARARSMSRAWKTASSTPNMDRAVSRPGGGRPAVWAQIMIMVA